MRRVKQPASLLSVRSARQAPVTEANAKPGDLSNTLSLSEGHPIALRAMLDRAFADGPAKTPSTEPVAIEAMPADDASAPALAARKRGIFGAIFRWWRRNEEEVRDA